jgi:hypothetical protein
VRSLTPRNVFSLLGDVSSTLREHSVKLRGRPSVTRVERQCEMVGGAQPSVEWYVDAELASTDALSWRLLLYWSGDTWVIEAETRRIRAGGSAVEAEFPARVAADDDLAENLRAAAEELVTTMPRDG